MPLPSSRSATSKRQPASTLKGRQSSSKQLPTQSVEGLLLRINNLKNQISDKERQNEELHQENMTLKKMLRVSEIQSKKADRKQEVSGEVVEKIIEELRVCQLETKKFQQLYHQTEKSLRTMHLKYSTEQQHVKELSALMKEGSHVSETKANLLMRVATLEQKLRVLNDHSQQPTKGDQIHQVHHEDEEPETAEATLAEKPSERSKSPAVVESEPPKQPQEPLLLEQKNIFKPTFASKGETNNAKPQPSTLPATNPEQHPKAATTSSSIFKPSLFKKSDQPSTIAAATNAPSKKKLENRETLVLDESGLQSETI